MTTKMTAAEFNDMKKPAANKFGARRTRVDGELFDSASEAKRWGELRYLEMEGSIRDLRRQVDFPLKGPSGPLLTDKGREIVYRADFVYCDTKTGDCVIEDRKGHPTPEYKLKKAIMAAMGLKIIETRS
ncbi:MULTISPECIES: DUF1064 domain-containing protein [Marivita]|uniref:DUF1064 domain-containing protein n=1 Tax=Marivita cryptomonadis TaxID=505252 RepID=A0A9Q2P5J8_9RHOB|nr:DUF1064 domain-containing protein [Marivita sp. LZ-15-2]MBM2322680.1 DUF1064 domain-containing protein [Marivita cryptomonadis]MCR9170080.1 DUF1064 domain-containing protein [Paracoccaceae bacterium]MBM2332262.1 DUF1064 domain-containing protein [Marivita cryptomonadis]MBM2341846.1 DUF1064 domain-containing protein [Marivita cryptomonadis]MBM2346510.1 DUF1064 domain-containing protein [Marivita cryptomonadis]